MNPRSPSDTGLVAFPPLLLECLKTDITVHKMYQNTTVTYLHSCTMNETYCTNIMYVSGPSQITNFEYLMHLNTLAGRTYNDMTQVSVPSSNLCAIRLNFGSF